jgi:competence protein ComEC
MSHIPSRMPSAKAKLGPARVPPLLLPLLASVGGVLVDRYGSPLETSSWLGLATSLCLVAGIGGRARRLSATAILAACFALAAGWHHFRWSDRDGNDLSRVVDETPHPCWVHGLVSEVSGFRPGKSPEDLGYTRAVFEITGIQAGPSEGWRVASGRAALGIVGDRSDLRPGDAVQVAGSLALVGRPLNPGEFDYQSHLRSQGIRLRLSVDNVAGVWPDEGSLNARRGWYWQFLQGLGMIRAWSQRTLAQGLDPDVAPLAAALLLGRREGVDPDVNDAFARTGTTHLLAISGLHMQVLAWALGRVLGGVGFRIHTGHKVVGLATLLYTVLVGFMPSVTRSAAMTLTYSFAGLRDRQARSGNTLALAGLATLGLNPSFLFDTGCQLSFLAVGAIVWGFNPLWARMRDFENLEPLDALERSLEAKWKSIVRGACWWVAEGLTMSSVVWLAALPLVALAFHIVSPIGILLNLPLIPITSAALLLSGLDLGLSAIWKPLGWPLTWCNAILLNWTESLVLWGSAQRWGHVFVAGSPWPWVLGFYVLLALVPPVVVGRWPGRRTVVGLLSVWVGAGIILALVPSLTARSLRAAPEAELLSVGHGLAVILDTGGGRGILYDCGRMRDPSVGRRVIAPALWAQGIRRLDAILLSHADADHYNGLPDLLDRIPIAAVLLPDGFNTGVENPGTAELLDKVRERGIPVKHLAAGEAWSVGETHLLVRHPPKDWSPHALDNARSLVLDVSWRGRHALLTGDLDGEGLAAFLPNSSSKKADVMLAPHHGGKTANPGWLYESIKPSLVVVSQRRLAAGARDALAPIESKGTPIIRTWQRGAIRLRWTDSGIAVAGFLDQPDGHLFADDAETRGW